MENVRRKEESRLDSLEENLKILANSGSKGIKLLYRGLNSISGDLS